MSLTEPKAMIENSKSIVKASVKLSTLNCLEKVLHLRSLSGRVSRPRNKPKRGKAQDCTFRSQLSTNLITVVG
jgi:hypothetical protein